MAIQDVVNRVFDRNNGVIAVLLVVIVAYVMYMFAINVNLAAAATTAQLVDDPNLRAQLINESISVTKDLGSQLRSSINFIMIVIIAVVVLGLMIGWMQTRSGGGYLVTLRRVGRSARR